MPRLTMSIAAAFLLGITLGIAGCAQVSELRTQLLGQTSDLSHRPADIWQKTADRGE